MSSRSGIGLDGDCIPAFDALKVRKYKYIIYKIAEVDVKDKASEDTLGELKTNEAEEEANEDKVNKAKINKAKTSNSKPSDSNKVKRIVVDKKSDDENYDSFLLEFPPDDCRFAVYDIHYVHADSGGERSKVCFFIWSPENAPPKSKMTYASSKSALRNALSGIHADIQGTVPSEVEKATVLEKFSMGA